MTKDNEWETEVLATDHNGIPSSVEFKVEEKSSLGDTLKTVTVDFNATVVRTDAKSKDSSYYLSEGFSVLSADGKKYLAAAKKVQAKATP